MLNTSANIKPKQPLKIAVLISGSGTNLQAIIDYQQQHPDLFEIAVVISNRPQAYGLQRAQAAAIATQIIDHTEFDNRESFDAELQKCLDNHRVELVVLAGFMRILTKGFTQHYLGRMLNIHPSLLPKYTGLNTHQRAIEAGDSEHGLSIHFVTPELDGGPVILQAKVTIDTDDKSETLANKVHTQEHLTYPLVVAWFALGRLKLVDNHAYLDGNCLNKPVIFNDLK